MLTYGYVAISNTRHDRTTSTKALTQLKRHNRFELEKRLAFVAASIRHAYMYVTWYGVRAQVMEHVHGTIEARLLDTSRERTRCTPGDRTVTYEALLLHDLLV